MEWFRLAQQFSPHLNPAFRGEAILHLFRGDSDRTVEVLSSSDDYSIWTCVDSGTAWNQRGESGKAIRQWQHCPQLAHLFLLLGQKNDSAGRAKAAEVNFRQAIAIDTGLKEAYYALGGLYRTAGRWAEAMEVYRMVWQRNQRDQPASVDMWALLAIGHLFREKGGGCIEALYWYELARATYPRNEFPYIYQGVCYPDALRKIESFRAAITINPKDFRGYYWLGVTYRQQNALQEARRYLEQATYLEPQDIGSLLTLADTYRDLKQYDRALSCYREVLELDPYQPRALEGVHQSNRAMGSQ